MQSNDYQYKKSFLLNVVNKEECVNAVSDLALRLLTTDPFDMKLDGNTPADH